MNCDHEYGCQCSTDIYDDETSPNFREVLLYIVLACGIIGVFFWVLTSVS